MKLSKRLLTIASMIPQGIPCADIGSDHGLLVEYLLNNKLVPFAYASDNKKGPFSRLNENLKKYIDLGLVETNLSDGLDNLPCKYKTVVIAGMGGELIGEIVSKNINLLENIEYLLLAPHGKEEEIRNLLVNHGFRIKDENVIFEGHFYEIMLFEKGSQNYSEFELKYGPINLMKKDQNFINKYQTRINSNKEILVNPHLTIERKQEVKSLIEEDLYLLNSLK